MKKVLSVLMLLILSAGVAYAEAPAPLPPVAPVTAETQAAPATRQSLFDPARHMRVADVRPGMKGFGLSVFSGDKIEKFDVVVVDVLKNFNPKYDAVLIRCKGDFLEHTGAIAGMSGSPIYLYDADGHAKMIGAFAYGWPMSKDPLAGVQPIEYMLDLPPNDPRQPAGTNAIDGGTSGHHADGKPGDMATSPLWHLSDVPLKGFGGRAPKNLSTDSNARRAGAMGLEPLATPLIAGGVNDRMLKLIRPMFAGTGLTLMQAGGGESASAQARPAPRFEPGSVLAVPLLTGDMDFTAVGTCTEVIGNRIFGFGHPFNGEGRIDLPVGTGWVATVVANLDTSFKLGYLSRTTGSLLTDETVGVAGKIGKLPPMIPVDIRVKYADGSIDQMYHFKSATHSKLTPQIVGAAVAGELAGERNLPDINTVDYDLTLDFKDGQAIHVQNRSVATEAPSMFFGGSNDIFSDMMLPMMAALDNPFKQVPLTKVSGTVTVSQDAQKAQIMSVMVPRTKYEPGDTVKAFVSYQPYHAEEGIMPVEMQLPRDLPNGLYQFEVSDWEQYFSEEQSSSPFKFTATNVDDMFKVLKDVESYKHNAIYLRLNRKDDGVAVGRVALSRLPSSRQQVMMGANRSDIVLYVSSTTKVIPTELVMSGNAQFQIKIEKHTKVDVASKKGKVETAAPPAAPAAPAKSNEPAPEAPKSPQH